MPEWAPDRLLRSKFSRQLAQRSLASYAVHGCARGVAEAEGDDDDDDDAADMCM